MSAGKTIAVQYLWLPKTLSGATRPGDQEGAGLWEPIGGGLIRCDSSDIPQKAVSRKHPVLLQQRCLFGPALFRGLRNASVPAGLKASYSAQRW